MELLNGAHANMNVRPRTRFSTMTCIRMMIVCGLILKMASISSIAVILLLKRREETKQPLKLFLGVYMGITIVRCILFLQKNRAFFNIDRIPEYRDNPDLALFSNFVEALVLFWYLIGFHWLQECTNCSVANPILYYTSAIFIVVGLAMLVFPLLAILALLLLKECIKPKLKIIKFSKPEDLPDETMTCTICFEQYELEAMIKFLPCSHHFHCECVDEWLSLRESCPLCKRGTGFFNEILDDHYETY